MPYNTRRKSLSLPSLGIQLPNSSRSSTHRSSPPNSTTSEQQPPAKKVKRSHSSTLTISTPTTPPRPSSLLFRDEHPRSAGRVADTPPPSPGGESGQTKVDTQGIDDIIVVGVIEQLEKTGNRPHLLKELAAVLATSIPIVESSANPAAIISSRLANYLKRSWTALSKCPLEKVLVGTHPKRVYYFLTTCPAQPIPTDTLTGPSAARIISPSLSSAASEDQDLEARSREQMSPSPELELSFEDSADPFSHQTHPPATTNVAHNRRAASPPLEREEREFTQMASSLQQRKREAAEQDSEKAPDATMNDVVKEVEETEESAARKNSETAMALFGQTDRFAEYQPSSPMMKLHLDIDMPLPDLKQDVKMTGEDFGWGWSELKSPENIELDELDDLFGGY
ncbi:hypothetical protein GQ43DRAFT_230897 [Delitschia confertaspora ATCC 74209]|uniref:GDS1 winged helix domain-containing protein n=1 Tax=Delitschia confertaspora ATCC 74209 TaxID=1513339 RepID=A0A9P4JCR6_9PLEO|nr:hypothetical protein GQ43DRAFT_230897 [Delitschia confertaspora ATCC 74209]